MNSIKIKMVLGANNNSIYFFRGIISKKDDKKDKEKDTLALVMGQLAKGDTAKNAQNLRHDRKHEQTFTDNNKTYCSNCWVLIG